MSIPHFYTQKLHNEFSTLLESFVCFNDIKNGKILYVFIWFPTMYSKVGNYSLFPVTASSYLGWNRWFRQRSVKAIHAMSHFQSEHLSHVTCFLILSDTWDLSMQELLPLPHLVCFKWEWTLQKAPEFPVWTTCETCWIHKISYKFPNYGIQKKTFSSQTIL